MHFGNRDARDLGPCLVCVCVVVQKLVPEHECYREQTVLAARLSFDARVKCLQAVDKQESEDDDVLCDLGGREDGSHPLAEACCRNCLGDQRLHVVRRCRVVSPVQCARALEPE